MHTINTETTSVAECALISSPYTCIIWHDNNMILIRRLTRLLLVRSLKRYLLDHAKFLQVILTRFGGLNLIRSLPSDVYYRLIQTCPRVSIVLLVMIDVF